MKRKELTFEFACRDDCLNRMVPSDLRSIIAQRDQLRVALKDARAKIYEWQTGCDYRTGADIQSAVKIIDTALAETGGQDEN